MRNITHKLKRLEGSIKQKRKRCTSCFEKIERGSRTEEARVKTKSENCDGKPPMFTQLVNM